MPDAISIETPIGTLSASIWPSGKGISLYLESPELGKTEIVSNTYGTLEFDPDERRPGIITSLYQPGYFEPVDESRYQHEWIGETD